MPLQSWKVLVKIWTILLSVSSCDKMLALEDVHICFSTVVFYCVFSFLIKLITLNADPNGELGRARVSAFKRQPIGTPSLLSDL